MPKESKSSLSLLRFNSYARNVHASIGVCESGAPGSGSLVTKHTTTLTESGMTFSFNILEVYMTTFFDLAEGWRMEAGREAASVKDNILGPGPILIAPPQGALFQRVLPPAGGARTPRLVIRLDFVQGAFVSGEYVEEPLASSSSSRSP